MSLNVLGISAFYHDSAAALVRDGEVVAAAQEERFSRRKHDPRFPTAAINYCLEEAFIEPAELDAVVFYDNPLLTLDRVMQNCLAAGEGAFEQFDKAARSVLGVKLWVQQHVERCLGGLGKANRLLYTDHHMSHAASAFYPSPFDEAAIVTLDGVGEWETTTLGRGSGSTVELDRSINYPHSLGLLYSAFTYFCGFKVNSGEYKLMGLAPYGTPTYEAKIREHLIDIRPDGSYRLNLDYFGYLDSLVMTNARFEKLFGGAPRRPESRITRREMDLAASIQKVTEDVMLRIATHARRESGSPRLCLAGGVALNCVGNGKIQSAGIFDEIWIQPAAGDAGGALGAALLATHAYFGRQRRPDRSGRDRQQGSLLGPRYQPAEVRAFLDRHALPYRTIDDDARRHEVVARALAEGKIVGYAVGRMEFGPRALGARSILGDPRRPETQSVMNLKIKYRESFRPFAPSCLAEDAQEYFDLDGESPYMLIVAPLREERRLAAQSVDSDLAEEDMIRIVNQARSDLPAITHVDYSARVQTVHGSDHPDFHGLIRAFKEISGVGVLVNTSFNVRGEPIVCSPRDAYRCFMRTEMDLLVLEDCLLWKEGQPAFEDDEDWRSEYELD